MKDRGIAPIIIVVVVVVAVAAAGAYVVVSGNGGGAGGGGGAGTISSIDATFSGYDLGELTGSIRIRARGLQTDEPDWRVEETPSGDIWMYNSDEDTVYWYTASMDSWDNVSGTLVSTYLSLYGGFATGAEGIAAAHGTGTWDMTYGGTTFSITINEVNPTLSDSLFTH